MVGQLRRRRQHRRRALPTFGNRTVATSIASTLTGLPSRFTSSPWTASARETKRAASISSPFIETSLSGELLLPPGSAIHRAWLALTRSGRPRCWRSTASPVQLTTVGSSSTSAISYKRYLVDLQGRSFAQPTRLRLPSLPPTRSPSRSPRSAYRNIVRITEGEEQAFAVRAAMLASSR